MIGDFVQVPRRTSTFKLIDADPPRIDLTTIHHDGRPTLYTKAIYELHRNNLTYCVAAPGRARPTAFATTTGDGCTLVTLQRVPMGVKKE
jgi:uncharacterized protein (TIGR03067 family)